MAITWTSSCDTYTNPIIPGFAPDPSVVLVDGTFFLVTSSFHLFPGIPIYASKDLKSWTLIGHAIHRKEQIDLTHTQTKVVALHHGGNMVGAGGLFAPTIRHHDGTFYIVCTNVGEEGEDFNGENFYVSTTDIWNGEWSDPKPLEFRGIDPSLFIDEDGRAYIQGAWRLDRAEQPYSTIKQYQIDLQTGQRLSEIRELWPGSAQIYTEGPHIYKKDGFYYLLVAEGGTFEHHMLSIARSRSLWGPYESCPQNPILTAYGKEKEIVQDVGHGELFQDNHGLWWAAVLGVRKVDNRYPLGRESFLAPIEWPDGDWPRIEHPRLSFQRQVPARQEWSCLRQKVRAEDCFIRSPQAEDYLFAGETISLRPSSSPLTASVGSTSFVGRRQRSIESNATVDICLTAQNMKQCAIAGLAVYKDDFRSASIAINFSNNVVFLKQRLVAANGHAEDAIVAKAGVMVHPGNRVQFRIRAALKAYEFQYRIETTEHFVTLGVVDTIDFTARDFTGTILGVFAHQTVEQTNGTDWISFENFTVMPSSSYCDGSGN